MNTGQVCLKIAGRDAGNICVVIKTIDKTYVLIDGNTRRRKCNIQHLEPLDKTLTINEEASHADVLQAMTTAGLTVAEKKQRTKEKKTAQKQKRQHATRKKAEAAAKPQKKTKTSAPKKA